MKDDSAKTSPNEEARIKEVCHRIQVLRSDWEALHHAACPGERDRALALYNTVTQREILWNSPNPTQNVSYSFGSAQDVMLSVAVALTNQESH